MQAMTSPQSLRELFRRCIDALQHDEHDDAQAWLARAEPAASDAAAIALKEALARRLAQTRTRTAQTDAQNSAGATTDRLPFVAIVTPTYNVATFIDETIESVVRQRGTMSVHYHVQDGGSTDGTLDILKRWEETLAEGRAAGAIRFKFTWHSEPDAGLYDGIARGFARIFEPLSENARRAAIMTWINGDDLLATRALWTVCSFFEAFPDISWITGTSGLLDESGAVIASSSRVQAYYQPHIVGGGYDGRALPFIQQEGTFWRQPLWDSVDGLDGTRFRIAGDWDLWRRFAKRAPLVAVNSGLAYHRRRKGQISADLRSYYDEVDDCGRVVPTLEGSTPSGMRAEYDLIGATWRLFDAATPVPQGDSFTEDDFQPATLPSGRPWPKISIVTPSFNQGRYIEETIRSVLDQGYPNVEHIVVDALSDDGTLEVLDRYRSRLARVIREPDGGQSDALNKGFSRATGEILCWLNSDDQLAPGALLSVAVAFDTHDADMVSGLCEVYQDGRLLHRHMSSCEDGLLPLNVLLDLDTGWNTGQFFYQPEVFFTRDIWARAGSHVRTDCHYSMDYELWCRFAFAGAKIHVIGNALAKFRMHAAQKTADPSKFKAELVSVRSRFVADRQLVVPAPVRPSARWDRTLRVALVNDIGLLYGAGIAQGRLAAGIDMAGHDTKLFELVAFTAGGGGVDVAAAVEAVDAYRPDVVVFGNLHAADRASVEVIDFLSKRHPCFWLTHDFWLFTGRCAYPGDCTKYLTGCDSSCPTPTEYPELAPDLIHRAWAAKHALLDSGHAPVLLANSRWSRVFAESAVAGSRKTGGPVRLSQVRLGAPIDVYAKTPKSAARLQLGLPTDHFVVAFSVSALSEERKGGHILLEALRTAGIPKLTLLLIGNLDRPLQIDGVAIVSLGYVTDVRLIVTALSAASVYVGPSLAETLGQVFIEAALVGTPSIGFDQSGVRDSIVHGVTGLRIESSAAALRAALRSLHTEPDLGLSLGYWAAIYARNEFSLETSYRSLFNVWQACGLVDKWELPNRISYVRASQYVPRAAGSRPKWRPESGFSGLEGPYPGDYPMTFRWVLGPRMSFRLDCGSERLLRFCITYYSPLFDTIELTVGCEGLPPQGVTIHRNIRGRSATAEFVLNVRPGWCSVTVVPDRWREPTSEESRLLCFMLCDIVVDTDQSIPP